METGDGSLSPFLLHKGDREPSPVSKSVKVLILGASGFLEGAIYSKIKNSDNEVLGTYSKNRKDNGYVKLDVFDINSLINLLGDFKPDVIIWTVMDQPVNSTRVII